MEIPDYQTIMRPLLVLFEDGLTHKLADLHDVLCEYFELTPVEIKIG